MYDKCIFLKECHMLELGSIAYVSIANRQAIQPKKKKKTDDTDTGQTMDRLMAGEVTDV